MADVSVKERVSRRMRTNFRHRGDDCRDGQRPRHTVAERIEFDQYERRRALSLSQVQEVANAVIEHETREVYVKPNNGSGYYGYYTVGEDGKMSSKLITFHCSDEFQYPKVDRSGNPQPDEDGDIPDFFAVGADPETDMPDMVAFGVNQVLIDMNAPDYDDEPDDYESAFAVAMEHGYDVLETHEHRTHAIITARGDDGEDPEALSEYVPGIKRKPLSLWHCQGRPDSDEHRNALAALVAARLREPTANDVLPPGNNYFVTQDANV